MPRIKPDVSRKTQLAANEKADEIFLAVFIEFVSSAHTYVYNMCSFYIERVLYTRVKRRYVLQERELYVISVRSSRRRLLISTKRSFL